MIASLPHSQLGQRSNTIIPLYTRLLILCFKAVTLAVWIVPILLSDRNRIYSYWSYCQYECFEACHGSIILNKTLSKLFFYCHLIIISYLLNLRDYLKGKCASMNKIHLLHIHVTKIGVFPANIYIWANTWIFFVLIPLSVFNVGHAETVVYYSYWS